MTPDQTKNQPTYPSSHHGSEKWVPPIVVTFQIQPVSTSTIMGERVTQLHQPNYPTQPNPTPSTPTIPKNSTTLFVVQIGLNRSLKDMHETFALQLGVCCHVFILRLALLLLNQGLVSLPIPRRNQLGGGQGS